MKKRINLIQSIENCEYLLEKTFQSDAEKIVLANDIKCFQVCSTNKHILLPIALFEDLLNNNEKREYMTLGTLKHELEHVHNHHVLKSMLTQIYAFLILLATSYCVWNRVKVKMQQFFKNLHKKYRKIKNIMEYLGYLSASGITVISCFYGSSMLIGKTLDRYFERCADNFTHENPNELYKLRTGMIDCFIPLKNNKSEKS